MRGTRKTFALTKGLRPRVSLPRNSEFLRECLNFRVGEAGLEGLTTLSDPTSSTVSWPFPQLVDLQRETLLLTGAEIKVVNADWSTTTKLSGLSPSSWHVADFGTYVVLSDGSKCYERDSTTGAYAATASASFPWMATVCAFRGQLLGGGVQSSWYDCDDRYAVWSAIGEATFETDWKNESGYRDMEIGTIYRAIPLGEEGVVYYGEKGVAMLFPAKQTYGYKKLSSIGCAGRSSMAGAGKPLHIYMSPAGELWEVTNEGVKRFGFSEWFSALSLSSVIISQDPALEDFYVSDGSLCYVLTKSGLSESGKSPTGLNRVDGDLIGAFSEDSTKTHYQLLTDYIDFQLVSKKALEFVELGVICDGTIEVRGVGTYQLGESATTLPWIRVNPSGFAYPHITANFLQVGVRSLDATSFDIDYLTIGVKLSDNRIQNQLQTLSDGTAS